MATKRQNVTTADTLEAARERLARLHELRAGAPWSEARIQRERSEAAARLELAVSDLSSDCSRDATYHARKQAEVDAANEALKSVPVFDPRARRAAVLELLRGWRQIESDFEATEDEYRRLRDLERHSALDPASFDRLRDLRSYRGGVEAIRASVLGETPRQWQDEVRSLLPGPFNQRLTFAEAARAALAAVPRGVTPDDARISEDIDAIRREVEALRDRLRLARDSQRWDDLLRLAGHDPATEPEPVEAGDQADGGDAAPADDLDAIDDLALNEID